MLLVAFSLKERAVLQGEEEEEEEEIQTHFSLFPVTCDRYHYSPHLKQLLPAFLKFNKYY